MALRRAPWNDEGWFADPAYTLLTKGYMGSPIIHPHGTWLARELTGIQTHTYWIMPGFPLLEAAWYRCVGFGLLQMRSLSILAGLIVIWSWAFLVWKLTSNKRAAYVTAGLLGADITFLYSSSEGRMDMTTAAFGSLGLVVYLLFREKDLVLALLGANALIAGALLCHPNGALYGLLLLLFVARYDFRSLRWRHAASLTPYVLAAGLWGAYILQRPDYFVAQFRANAEPPLGNRLTGLQHPISMLVQEVSGRYLEHFGGSSAWAQLPPLSRVIPFLYWFCLLWLLVRGVRAGIREAIFLGVSTAAAFLFMGVFIGFKGSCYLVLILPLYAGAVAVAAFPERGRYSRIGLLALTALATADTLCLSTVLNRDEYDNGFRPAVRYLREHASRQDAINGSPGLLFALPSYRLVSDSRLQELADYVMVDRWYGFDWGFVYPTYEPETAIHVREKLKMYEPIFSSDGWTVLRRRSPRLDREGGSPPVASEKTSSPPAY